MSNDTRGNNNVKLLEDYILYNGKVNLDKSSFIGEKEYIISRLTLSIISGAKDFEYKQLIEYLQPKLQEVVKYRWEAIVNIFNGNFDVAETLLLGALEKAKEKRLEKWIRRDILLDIRNLELLKYNREGKLFRETPHQKELSGMGEWNYRPLLDWNMENSSFDVIKESFSLNTDGPHTVRFGGNLSSSLEEIAAALCSTITMGSYTFIHIIRERLAYILYNYGKLYEDPKLLYHSLRLFIIEHKVKNVKKVLNSEWENLFTEFIDTPTLLLDSSILEGEQPENIVMKCVLIEKLGPYFFEEELPEINAFLFGCLNKPFSLNEKVDIKRNAIRAYRDVINRINNEHLLNKLIKMLETGNDLEKDEIYKLISYINWKEVSEEISGNFAKIIYRKKEEAFRTGNVYSVLLSIKKAHPDILGNIENEMIIEWESNKNLDINFYFSAQKINEPLYNKFMEDILNRIDSQNKDMVNGSSISIGGNSLYHLWANHTINSSILKKESLELYKKVLLNPYQTSKNKIECVESIKRVVNENKFNLSLILVLKSLSKEGLKDILVSRNDHLFEPFGNEERLKLKLIDLFIHLEITTYSIEEILAMCIELGSHTIVDVRESTLSLVESILNKSDDSHKNSILQFLYSKTFDAWYKVRGDSIFLINSVNGKSKEWERIIHRRMFDLIEDSNSYVRSSIIASINEYNKKNANLRIEFNKMLAILKRDRHYKLRNQVLSIR
jgi:hypothetical protein